MAMRFVNRVDELKRLEQKKRKFSVLFGRRRVGKTSLIEHWNSSEPIFYSQAIEASEFQQIQQIMEDFRDVLPEGLTASSWTELFPILSLISKNCVLVFDEFPYLVRTEKSLPSQMQRWIDHKQPNGVSLMVLGSSQTMMSGIFLSSSSPLYERADQIIHLEPMSYSHFCEAVELDPLDSKSFETFSLVGGVPKYWSYIEKDWNSCRVADELYFRKGAYLESEPDRLLKDEDINGLQAKAIFEALGRGAHKPSEIANRLGIKQTGLSKPINILLQTSLVTRSLPFGENIRSSKKILYNIKDHALEFWYGTFSPHRSRWHLYNNQEKKKLIHDHASKILEKSYRDLFPDGERYWDGKENEFDCVRLADASGKNLIVSEITHKNLSKKEQKQISTKLEEKFSHSKLSSNYNLAKTEALGIIEVLEQLVKE